MKLTIHQRIEIITFEMNISISQLEQRVGLKKGSLIYAVKNKSKISHKVMQKIHEKLPQYHPNWLITGRR